MTADQFQNAKRQIAEWRGRCLDICAKTERAVGITLELAFAEERDVKLRHLAGHRLDDLLALAASEKATAKQRSALIDSINYWRDVESHRPYLAHACATELFDGKGEWHVRLDHTSYRSNTANAQRLVLSRQEAEALEARLETGFKTLSAQLGQLRKRLKD